MKLALAALLALTVLRLAVAAILPLAPDEAYYLLWAQHLQPGYFDHPPMVALWIRAGTMLCGNTALGVRLLGPLAAVLGTVLLWDAAEQIKPGRGILAGLLLNATLMIGAGAVIMTPDTPLLLFWTAGLAACVRLIVSGNPRWWLAVGLAAGGMLLSKYTAALFIAAVFFWLLSRAEGRRQLGTVWPWAGIILALVIFAPNIAWNAAHGWVSYMKQGGREAHFAPGRSLQFLVELCVGQIGLFTPGIFGLALVGVWRLKASQNAVARLLLWLILLPLAMFAAHVLSDRVQGNWLAIIYPAACLAVVLLPEGLLRRWVKPSLAVGFGLTALAYVQAVAAPFPLPVHMDTAALQLAGWREFAAAATTGQPAFVTSDDYATAAILAVDGPRNVPVLGFGPRWESFGYATIIPKGTVGVLVTRRKTAPCAVRLGTATRQRGVEIISTYRLCRFVAPGPGLALPRP